MNDQNPVQPPIEEKVVKFEIGKLLAVVIAVVVIAGVAGVYLQSTYFKGTVCDSREYCGNGFTCPQIEECDDGNLLNGDGCSSTCKIEPIGASGFVDGSTATIDSNNNIINSTDATTATIEPVVNLDASKEEATTATIEPAEKDFSLDGSTDAVVKTTDESGALK